MLLLLWTIFSFTFTYSFSNVLSLCRFKGFDLCSFSSKELILTFFARQVSWQQISSIFVCLRKSLFLFCLFFSFFSFLYSHYVYITPLVVILQFLDIPFCYGFLFFCLCSLCFSVWEVSIETSLSSETLSSAVLNLLISL